MARRKHLPDGWETVVQRGVAYWQLLGEPERQQLVELADFIVGNKRWEAARGFELTDEVVVTIAVEAAVLILGLDASYFGKVTTIIVHPTTFSIPGPHATEIVGMLDVAGFETLGLLADLDGSEYELGAERLLVIAERRGSDAR